MQQPDREERSVPDPAIIRASMMTSDQIRAFIERYIDLWQREITVRGKGGKDRIVRIGHHAARSLDRYIRARSRHAQAWRPQLWLGSGNREPLTAAGIYQMIARRGRQCGVDAYPHRFRHHFSHTWLDRGGPEGT